jgi:hypothetical protein
MSSLRLLPALFGAMFVWQVSQVHGQQNYYTGKVAGVGRQGIALTATDGPDNQPIEIAANNQTQVRINVLAKPERIVPGTYVEMRVLWDGENLLRATAIRIPEESPSKFGLFEG